MELGFDIGVDVGGTYTVAGIVRDGKVLETNPVPTNIVEHPSTAQVLGQMEAAVQPLLSRIRRYGQQTTSVAYALPALASGTTVVGCINIPSLVGVDLAEQFSYPTSVQRDNTAYAMKKAMDYSRIADRVVGVIFGTGVSACAIDGIPVCFGHDKHKCTSDVYASGELESKAVHELLGAPGVRSRFREQTGIDAALQDIWQMPHTAFHQEIMEGARDYLRHVTKVFDPQLIVIGGGHAQSLVPAMRKEYPFDPLVRNLRLSNNTSEDAILGAVALSKIGRQHEQPAMASAYLR